MKKSKRGIDPELRKPEALIHLLVHAVAVLILYGIVLLLPVMLAIILIVLEVWQMKHFGHCFLTVYAHKRGFMRKMTYWEYVPYAFGIKNYKAVDKVISGFIKVTLVGILLFRTINLFL